MLCSVSPFQVQSRSRLLHHHAFLSSFCSPRDPKSTERLGREKDTFPRTPGTIAISFSISCRTQHGYSSSSLERRFEGGKRGMGSGSLLKVLAKNFDVLAGPLVALAYPLYASVKAIETKSPVDDQQWLTYWVLYSLITLFELTFASIIEWLPFWSSMKLIFISWLVLPYFNGAAYVYQNYVRPVFVKNQMVNIWYVPQKKGLFGKSDDFLVALDKFIQENGPDALKKLTDKAGKPSKEAGKLWKGSKESKSSKESKEPKVSKDAKDSKPSKDSKLSKDSKEQKKALKDSKEQKKTLKGSKEHTALKDWKELKTSLKDPKKPEELKDSNEPTPKKSSKRVTFAEVEHEKEFKASNSDWHATSDYHSAYPEHNSWNSSFMIFDEHSYWN